MPVGFSSVVSFTVTTSLLTASPTAPAASGGPAWTDVMTAVGTVAVALAAVGVAFYTEWRSGRRLQAEHERSDRLLAEERERSAAQIEEERRLARERDQLAEAYAVQVALAETVIKFLGEEQGEGGVWR